MTEWRGAPVAKKITEAQQEEINALKADGICPRLSVLRVGRREDDLSYERGILKRFATAGAEVLCDELPEDVSQQEIEALMQKRNADPAVHGILLFRPLPKQLDAVRLAALIAPEKDVDGMSPVNQAKIFSGAGDGFAPCTAQAVIELLEGYAVPLAGLNVTVVGRSLVIGRPVAMLLLSKNATVTVCHTKTKALPALCKKAELLVVAAGVPKLVNGDFLSAGQRVVDVGIHLVEDRLCGDVDADAAAGLVAAYTPVPGGVGAVTTSVLLKQVVQAAKLQNGR